MKLCVEFPSVSYREGPGAVYRLAENVERIGYDQLEVFDHVTMGFPMEGRENSRYPAKMPIIEALTLLAFAAAATKRIGLGTEVLVLPQRQPALVAKQVSSIDTLSNGRMRLGVGIGWQPSEFEALGENYRTRGKRMDEAIELLRACWRDERVDHDSAHYSVRQMGFEPKPPQGGALPIWVGGNSTPALERVGRLGDGWLASQVSDAQFARRAVEIIHASADRAGRDPESIGLQSMIAPPPREGDSAGKSFYADTSAVVERVGQLRDMGFESVAVNATAVFQSGARSVDAIIERLEELHAAIRAGV